MSDFISTEENVHWYMEQERCFGGKCSNQQVCFTFSNSQFIKITCPELSPINTLFTASFWFWSWVWETTSILYCETHSISLSTLQVSYDEKGNTIKHGIVISSGQSILKWVLIFHSYHTIYIFIVYFSNIGKHDTCSFMTNFLLVIMTLIESLKSSHPCSHIT